MMKRKEGKGGNARTEENLGLNRRLISPGSACNACAACLLRTFSQTELALSLLLERTSCGCFGQEHSPPDAGKHQHPPCHSRFYCVHVENLMRIVSRIQSKRKHLVERGGGGQPEKHLVLAICSQLPDIHDRLRDCLRRHAWSCVMSGASALHTVASFTCQKRPGQLFQASEATRCAPSSRICLYLSI